MTKSVSSFTTGDVASELPAATTQSILPGPTVLTVGLFFLSTVQYRLTYFFMLYS